MAAISNRIVSLDLLRGIAALSVIIFHYTASTSIHLSEYNPLRFLGVYGHYGVEIFFIVSGFVIPYSMNLSSYTITRFGNFLLRRMIRIEVPYLALVFLEVILIYISSLTPWKNGLTERLDAYNILLHIGHLNEIAGKPWLIPVFWTLAIEFQFYLLIAVVFPLIVHENRYYRTITMIALATSGFVFAKSFIVFFHLPYFVVGILAFQYLSGVIKRGEFISSIVVIGIIVFIRFHPFSLLVTVLTVAVILFFRLDWKWTGFLGMISYSLYLIHVPLGGRLLLLTQIYVQSEIVKSLLIIVYMMITIFAAWLFYRWIEQPPLALSKKIRYQNVS
jgi:peptidoglycan/LPS O-acetylase OafA/YrhL